MKRLRRVLTTGGGGEDEGAPGRSWTRRPGGVDGEDGEEERGIFNLFLLLPERCKIIPMLKGNGLLEHLRKLGDLFGL